MKIKKGVIGKKIIQRQFWLLVQAQILPQKGRKVWKCAKSSFSRGGLNKGHPIRTRISRSKSSLGHFLTLVDNLEKKYFAFTILLYCRIFRISARWWTLFFLHIFGSSSPWGNPIFIWTTQKNLKFCIDIKRPLTFYSSLNFWYKKYRKHFLQVASKPVL